MRAALLGLAAPTSDLTLSAAAPAVADSARSSNWSGYAGRRGGVSFRSVAARWRVPSVSCTAGPPAYSAMRVGPADYSYSSAALEQTGTESDCSASGQAIYSARPEIPPAGPTPVALRSRAGDLINASVAVADRRVTIVLEDLADHCSFTRPLYRSTVDTSSAEWTVEAPSGCAYTGACEPLPLANFGRAGFSSARARTVGGRSGTIRRIWWDTTKITLASGGRQFASENAVGSSAEAMASGVSSNSSKFGIAYKSPSSGSLSATARGFSPRSAELAPSLIHHTRQTLARFGP